MEALSVVGAEYGCGTVFKLDPTGKKTVLYAFRGKMDGIAPNPHLIRDDAGNFYGTTSSGGDRYYDRTIFKLDSTGKETILHRFNRLDGSRPEGGVIRDVAGNLYGTTTYGGSYANPEGTVFKLT